MVSVVFPQTLCLQRESSSDPLTGEEEAASWKETARQRLVQEERRGQEAQLKSFFAAGRVFPVSAPGVESRAFTRIFIF